MERSGFFNSKLDSNGTYDKPYSADDYSKQLATVIGNGVTRSSNFDDETGESVSDLKVTASTDGLHYNVNIGRAWINGCWYHNMNVITEEFEAANVSAPRKDAVILRLAYEEHEGTPEREIRVAYLKGEASALGDPQPPTLTRTDTIYEMVLAYINLPAGATSITQANIQDMRYDRNVCGWTYAIVGADEYFKYLDEENDTRLEEIDAEWQDMKDAFSSVTLFKKYEDEIILDATTTRISVPITQFNANTDILEVFVNGIYIVQDRPDKQGDYYLEGNIVVFHVEKPAGNEISFSVYKSIDSRGDVPSLLDMITELQNKMSNFNDMTEYNYFPTGVNDNWKISELVTTFLTGSDVGKQLKINIYDRVTRNGVTTNLHIATPFSGEGTSTSNRFRWFDFGTASTKKKVVLDFSYCSKINIPISAGSYNVLFHGNNLEIIGGSFSVDQKATYSEIQAFSNRTGEIICRNCSFFFSTYQHTFIAENGTFIDCYAEITQETGETCCFDVHTSSLLIVERGEYLAYSKSGNSYAVKSTQTGASLIMHAVNCPTVAKSGYVQTHAVNATGGTAIVRETISALTVTAGTVSGTIAVSKARRS